MFCCSIGITDKQSSFLKGSKISPNSDKNGDSKHISRYGCVSVVEFPELLQAAEKKSRLRNPPKSEEAKFDAEIDRLCDLKALEKKASKNTNRQGSKPDTSKGIQLNPYFIFLFSS